MSASPQPVAAWFPDPTQPGQLRWWDGSQWTDHVQLAPPDAAAIADPVEAPHPLVTLRDDQRWIPYPDARRQDVRPDAADVAAAMDARRRALMAGWIPGLSVMGAVFLLGLVHPVFFVLALVLAVIGAFAWTSRNGPKLQAGMEAFCADRGLRITGNGGRLRVKSAFRAWTPSPASILSGIGSRRYPSGAWIEGRLWRASPVCRITDESNGPMGCLVIEVPLEPDVAARYPGLLVLLGTPTRDTRHRAPHGWVPVDLGHAPSCASIGPFRREDQEELAAWELLDPAFVDRMVTRFRSKQRGDIGFGMVDGSFFMWVPTTYGFRNVAIDSAARLGLLRSAGIATGECTLVDDAITTARDVYRRVFAEFL